MVRVVCVLAALLAPPVALALPEAALRRGGFVALWEGEAALGPCMSAADHAWLDRYRFSCDVRPYGAIFHRGAATLYARKVGEGSGARIEAFLCFAGRADCVEGSLARRD
jgi:hypothetical protein